jgi:hypothetical protein
MLHPVLPVAPPPRASLLVPSSAPSPVSLRSPNLAPNAVAFDPDCPVFLPATHLSHQLSACRLPRTCSEIGEALFCIYLFSTRIFADAICFVFCEVVNVNARVAAFEWLGSSGVAPNK